MSVARQWKSGVCWSDAIDVNSILNVIRQENTRKVHNCLALPIQMLEDRVMINPNEAHYLLREDAK